MTTSTLHQERFTDIRKTIAPEFQFLFRNTFHVQLFEEIVTKTLQATQSTKRQRRGNEDKECECGKIGRMVKGLCPGCYSKYYQRKKFGRKERIKIDSETLFNKVLTEVKEGATIGGACKYLKISRSGFYKLITTAQKAELKAYKIIGKIGEHNLLNFK